MTIEQYRERYGGISHARLRELILSDAVFRKETDSLYTEIYGKHLNHSCPNCWEDGYLLLIRTTKEKAKAMMERDYELKAGAIVYVEGVAKNRHTLTDAEAREVLRLNPNEIQKFVKFPKDWHGQAIKASNERDLAKIHAESVQDAPKTEEKEEAVKSTAKRNKAVRTAKKH